MLEFVGIAVGDGGSLGCALCAARPAVAYRPTSLVLSRIAQVTADWPDTPGPNILLTGPEPFEHPELPALVAACVQAGAERIGLETDAAALSAHGNAAGVLRAGVRHLRVRIMDCDQERGDRLAGRPGRTSGTLAGVRAYLDAAEGAGLTVVATAVVPVCRHNLAELPAIVAGIASARFHAARLVRADELPATAAMIVSAACDTGMVNGLWVEVGENVPLPGSHGLHAAPEPVKHA